MRLFIYSTQCTLWTICLIMTITHCVTSMEHPDALSDTWDYPSCAPDHEMENTSRSTLHLVMNNVSSSGGHSDRYGFNWKETGQLLFAANKSLNGNLVNKDIMQHITSGNSRHFVYVDLSLQCNVDSWTDIFAKTKNTKDIYAMFDIASLKSHLSAEESVRSLICFVAVLETISRLNIKRDIFCHIPKKHLNTHHLSFQDILYKSLFMFSRVYENIYDIDIKYMCYGS